MASMHFITFQEAYLPDSDNITRAVKCIVNIDQISLILPLEGDISGARAILTVAGRQIHVVESLEEIIGLLGELVRGEPAPALLPEPALTS